MSLPTFYIPPDQIDGDTAKLTGDELRHARLTLRLGAGDTVRIVDGDGRSWEGSIRSMSKEMSDLSLARPILEPTPGFSLTVAMGIVQGCWQVGVENPSAFFDSDSINLFKRRNSTALEIRVMMAATMIIMKRLARPC